MFSVAKEPADQPEIQRLLDLSDAVAASLYPGAFRQPLNSATLSRPDIALYVARNTADIEGSCAVGCAALLDLSDGTAELKRMIVDPEYANRGIGSGLVHAALEGARQRGMRSVLLEVGIRNIKARRLYERAGFRDRGPFASYRDTPIATFMEISL